MLQCGASGRKGLGRGDITFPLDVSSTAAVDIFWRFDVTTFTSSESAANWIYTRNGSAMCTITAAAVDETSSENIISPRPRPFRPEAPHCSNYTGRESFKDYMHLYVFIFCNHHNKVTVIKFIIFIMSGPTPFLLFFFKTNYAAYSIWCLGNFEHITIHLLLNHRREIKENNLIFKITK